MVVLLLAVLAQTPIPNAVTKRGTLSFDGKATLGDFVGTTDSVRGELRGAASLDQVTGWVEAPVASLRTGNGKRDKDLRKSMEVERYPVMRFDLKNLIVTAAHDDVDEVALRGTLTIHGRTRDVDVPGKIWRIGAGWHVQATFPLNLKDYEIGGLSKMLGILKMDEHILVHVDVTFGT
jgi:polyisoprenoid-binding protein YceI